MAPIYSPEIIWFCSPQASILWCNHFEIWMVPQDMLTKCKCRRPFSVDHSLNCPKGDSLPLGIMRFMILLHHYSVLFAMMYEGWTQPPTIAGETVAYRTANMDIEARSDISACGFWQLHFEKVFKDVRIFNPNAESHHNLTLETCFRQHE